MKPLLSNEKSNQLTRSKIRDALSGLLKKKSYDKISITDIVSTAGVSRNSFYRNYKEKEDIVLEMSADFGKGLLGIVGNEAARKDVKEWFVMILNEIQSNKDLMKIMFKCGITKFLMFGKKQLVDMIFEPQNKNDYYQMCAYLGSVISIIYAWIENDMPEDIDYIATLCSEITDEAFYGFKFKEYTPKE